MKRIFKVIAAVWALTFFNVGIAQGQTLVDLTIHLERTHGFPTFLRKEPKWLENLN